MTSRFAFDLFVWLALWVAGWGLYALLLRRQIDYVRRFAITSAYFLAFSAVIVLLFRRAFGRIAAEPDATPFIVLFLTYMVSIVLYWFSRTYLRRPQRLIDMNPHELFLTLDYRYLVSKSCELLYQQIMIVLLILMIHRATTRMTDVIMIYGVVFAGAHLPIYRLIGTTSRMFKLFYLVAALISAIVFPVLTLNVNTGFVYSYIIHLSFYTLSALFFWGMNTAPGRES